MTGSDEMIFENEPGNTRSDEDGFTEDEDEEGDEDEEDEKEEKSKSREKSRSLEAPSPGNLSDLNSLRLKLKRPIEVSEPSLAQLVATGEADAPDEDNENEQNDEKSTAIEDQKIPSTSLIPQPIPQPSSDTSIRKQIEQALASGISRDELVARGFNKRSVQTVASELKSKMNTRTAIGRAPATTSKGMPIFAHGSPPEAIIDSVRIPDVANGEGVSFEQGMKFGMSVVILGVRVAQELSGIGITQAKPILDMAKSMREGEAIAAKNAAGEAAEEAAGRVEQALMPVLANMQRNSGGGGEGVDPMKAMMSRTMEPIMQKLMSGMLSKLVPGTTPPQLTEGTSKIEGWTRREE